MTGRRVATQEQVRTKTVEPRVDAADPAFHRAILKIALELKKPNALSYDEIVVTTIRAMRLDATAFRRFLGENGGQKMSLMLATARSIVP
jgi:hypothetical protein